MSQPVITVEGLGKRYTLHHQARSGLLRDRLAGLLRNPFRRAKDVRDTAEEFWALRDVNFSVNQGDVVGIIGRNGAGKSTLLKILSRITEPTTGRITIHVRIASLLEVGTGFHGELSGRENIFLNGAILGMKRAEIRAKFDEIVAFAEVEKYLDTPVKHYSSGMYVRLAFAVAAHLEPEILIVDEVLAVGDVAFQKKCLGKMQDVARTEGRTVLFVSHNLPMIRQLCTSAILLENGSLVEHGATSSILAAYAHRLANAGPLHVPKPGPDLQKRAYVSGLAVENIAGQPFAFAYIGEAWRVRIRVIAARPLQNFVCALGLMTNEGIGVQTVWTSPLDLPPGEHEISFTQQSVALAADSYTLVIGLSEGDQTFQQFDAARLEITGENPQIHCMATSGCGLVLNSMTTEIRKLA